MTAKDFRHAASMVRAILNGGWTLDTPAWAGPTLQPMDAPIVADINGDANGLNYTRAVWTAEALILFFQQDNPRFNQQKFLKACGLAKE